MHAALPFTNVFDWVRPSGHVEQEQSEDLPLAGVEKTEVQPKHAFWPVRD